MVERANGYLRSSFLPGRTFDSPADFNAQLGAWLATANARTHRVTRVRPIDALATDRAAMGTLPPVAPAVGSTTTTRLGRDYYVTVGGSAYSVHPDGIGRLITVTTDLERVRAVCDHRVLAEHARAWGAHAVLSDPQHIDAAKEQRKLYRSTQCGIVSAVDREVEVADLGAYDAVFGTGEVA